jgi:GDP-mannose 6-dehydrogenase
LNLGFLGLSGTEDLRERPLVELIETMIGKGFPVRIYDRCVSSAWLVGANKQYIDNEIPHISTLMCGSGAELMASSDVLIVGNRSPEFRDLVERARPDQVVIDLVRITEGRSLEEPSYYGLSW